MALLAEENPASWIDTPRALRECRRIMDIRKVRLEEVIPIRAVVLRSGRPLHESMYANDQSPNAFHLGLFLGDTLTSVSSYYAEPHPDIPGVNPYRLRGMATLEPYRGNGFGSALLRAAFPLLEKEKCGLLWCNARKNAIEFYERHGFSVRSDFFELPNIGPHVVMSLVELSSHQR